MKVLMFHSIGNENNSNWSKNRLSVKLEHFEHFCKYLHSQNFQTEHLNLWYKLQNDQSHANKKYVFLTFDDGYLDNWVYAYPLLKKYKLKGTIFINPEFVDPSDHVRHNLENLWQGEIDAERISSLGFLNWSEIKLLESYGVMDVQSHSMSHDFVFCSDEIIDIYEGQEDYFWFEWIFYPENKPLYLQTQTKNTTLFGFPIFRFDRALAVRKYIPDQRLLDFGKTLLARSTNQPKNEIIRALNNMKIQFPGRYETDNEMELRYKYELFQSKQILELKLNKTVNFLCWPGGGYNELSLRIAEQAGYIASTIGTKNKDEKYNNSLKYKRIPRSGIGSGIDVNGKRIIQNNHDYITNSFRIMQGNKILLLLRVLKRRFLRLIYTFG